MGSCTHADQHDGVSQRGSTEWGPLALQPHNCMDDEGAPKKPKLSLLSALEEWLCYGESFLNLESQVSRYIP